MKLSTSVRLAALCLGAAAAISCSNAGAPANISGVDAYHDGNLDQALGWFDSAISRVSPYVYGQNNRGATHYRTGDYASAILDYEASISASPAFDHAWNNLGVLQANRGEDERALQCFRRAEFHDADYGEPNFNIARMYFGQGRYEEALQQVDLAMTKGDPRDDEEGSMLYLRAMILEALGEHAVAAEDYKAAEEKSKFFKSPIDRPRISTSRPTHLGG